MRNIAGIRECAATHVEGWTRHRRALLAAQVRTASPVALAILAEARITPWRASVLAMRVACDADWNHGFSAKCVVVIRPEGDPKGRLGLWAEGGDLCVEAATPVGRVVVRGDSVEVETRQGTIRLKSGLVGYSLPAPVVAMPRSARGMARRTLYAAGHLALRADHDGPRGG